jgi:hypothetical protein
MPSNAPDPPVAKPRRNGILRTLIGSAVVAAVTLVTLIYLGVQTSLTAERNLHAMLDAIGACHSFVEQNDGAWPDSVSDLDNLHPDDREWIPRDAVHIDFQADPSQLAEQDWQSFTGITVDEPVYLAYECRLKDLITLLRHYHPPE